jgi:hypothetical protein
MQQIFLLKLPHQECHISNPFQYILPKKGSYFVHNQIHKEFWILSFKIHKKYIGDSIGESNSIGKI